MDDSAGGRFTINASTGVVTVNGAIDREAADQYDITIRATSSDTSFSVQTFTITIGDVDEFNVGSVTDSNATTNAVNENAAIGTVVGITASASDADATTNAITYSLFDSDGGNFQINSSTGVVTTAQVLNREALGASRNIVVRATSADGSFTDQSFTIDINDVDEFDASAPVDTDATANAVSENAAIGTVVGISASASDADATTNAITYSLFDSDGGNFQINSSTGVVTTAQMLNREALGASRNIIVRATSADGSFTDQSFTIDINDIDEFNTGSVSDNNAGANEVAENAAVGTVVGITAYAIDDDATTNAIVYTLLDNDGGRFQIDANTGVVITAQILDREALGANRSITVRATSADGSYSDLSFVIAINDVDEFDVTSITDADPQSNSVFENAANGTIVGITASASDADATYNSVTYTLDNSAGGRFAISSSGVVTVANGTALNFETATSHTIVVRATSQDGSFSVQSYTININDVDEFDVSNISDANSAINAVSENAAIGTQVGLAAFAMDADGSNNTITYSLINDDNGNFQIDPSSGLVSTAKALDRESLGATRTIAIRATSTDGSFVDQSFTIALMDLNEFNVNVPADTSSLPNAVAENAANGTLVGLSVAAADLDATNNVVTYSLSNDAGGRFQINSVTGEVSVKDGTLLNYESVSSHTITAVATSLDGSTSSTSFQISITDVNEAPVARSESFTTNSVTPIKLNASGLLANDTDPDQDALQIVITASPSLGTLVVGADGSITYTPVGGFAGKVYFEYYVTDGEFSSNHVVSSIDVTLLGGGGSTANASDAAPKPATSSGSTSSSTTKTTSSERPTDSGSQSQTSVGSAPTAGVQTSGNAVTTEERSPDPKSGTVGVQQEARSLAFAAEPQIKETQFLRLNGNAATELGRLRGIVSDFDLSGIRIVSQDAINSGGQRDVERYAPASSLEPLSNDESFISGKIDFENVVLTTMLSTGVFIWVLQGAHVVATVMSTAPVWLQLDPLIVMSQNKLGVGKTADEEKSLSMFDVDRKK